jgi:uncharacterized BrkB/YihY/UPF0761 family membrane protein
MPSQQGPDQLGAGPSMPPVPGQTPGKPVRPRAVDLACLMSLIGLMFGVVVVAVTTLADTASLRELTRQALEDSGQPDTEADVVNAMNLMRVSTVLALVIVLALVVLFVWKMRAGRNWARIVIVAVAAMNVITFLTNAGAIGLGVDFLLNAVSVALAVATVVYLFRAESNAYFLAMKQLKYGRPPRP